MVIYLIKGERVDSDGSGSQVFDVTFQITVYHSVTIILHNKSQDIISDALHVHVNALCVAHKSSGMLRAADVLHAVRMFYDPLSNM